jgi:hypothetical protein
MGFDPQRERIPCTYCVPAPAFHAFLAFPIAQILRISQGFLKHCDRAGDAFMLAEGWKRRMNDKGWHQVTPPSATQQRGGPAPT